LSFCETGDNCPWCFDQFYWFYPYSGSPTAGISDS
jgi:hypothetical protein